MQRDINLKVSKNLGACILDLALMLKYNYLHCFSILLDHANNILGLI